MSNEKSKRWLVTVPITVTLEAEGAIDKDAAIETALNVVSQSCAVVVPREGPENWANLWSETDFTEATAEVDS